MFQGRKNSMEKKNEIRRQVRERKRKMCKQDIEALSREIICHMESTKEFREAGFLYLYVSYNQEVDTRGWIESLLKAQRRIAVPKVVEKEIKFYELTNMAQLRKGYQGILEPVSDICVDGEPGVMILPGLAFDKKMHRCGYGGGFYDSYLHKYRDAKIKKIGFAFSFQMYEDIPYEEHDVLLDGIITEKGYFCDGSY